MIVPGKLPHVPKAPLVRGICHTWIRALAQQCRPDPAEAKAIEIGFRPNAKLFPEPPIESPPRHSGTGTDLADRDIIFQAILHAIKHKSYCPRPHRQVAPVVELFGVGRGGNEPRDEVILFQFAEPRVTAVN